MYFQKLIHIFLFCSLPLFAQQKINQYDEQGRRHGPWKVNFEGSDQTKFEGTFEHGKEIGEFSFYKRGFDEHPSAIMEFKDDNTTRATYYTQGGKPISQGMMKNKTREGKWVYFHNKSEDTMMVENYREGELDGPQVTYFPNGEIAEKTQYKHGKREGQSLMDSESGKLLRDLHYKEGELHGSATYYDNEGNKISEGDYKEDQKTGTWRYYENGNLDEEKQY